jgi:endonuclease G
VLKIKSAQGGVLLAQGLLSFFVLLLCQLALAVQSHLPQGFCSQQIDHTYYSLCYEPEHRQASWVKYKLNEDFIRGPQRRTNDFRFDPHVSEDPVTKTDYKGSGYDRGHLLPAGDMRLNRRSMSETFYMTNISPQMSKFNRYAWLRIEYEVRKLVLDYGEAHVVTGGILEAGLPRIHSGVSVPDWYFKVLYFPEKQMMRAFLITHQDHQATVADDFRVTVDEVEGRTGFDFFAELPDSIEAHLESEL